MFLFIKLYISKSDDFGFLPQGAGYDKHWGGASQGCVHGGVEGRRGGWLAGEIGVLVIADPP